MLQAYYVLFELMETLGKKWVVHLLLFLLIVKQTNFSTLKKRLNLTSRALSLKLKDLRRLGLVRKSSPKNNKENVYYSLSDKGKNIVQSLVALSSSDANKSRKD